jgi:ABC-type Mn2+/Zn2+ transport system ATPase subunit
VWKAAGVRFENVWLRYDRRSPWVLQAVDVALGRGQVAVVLGKNGAGKTTLLAAAAGLLRPERGTIADRPARVGWVPERFPANQPFTVGAYLVGMARSHGLSRAAALEQVELWCDRLYLSRYFDTNLAEVSKGTAQKVGLVQALIPRPDLLVLDEPWEGLDGPARDMIPDIVGELLSVGASVLVSDHVGEVTTRLPGALRWHVEGNRVDHYQVAGVDQVRYIVELSVPATEVPTVVAELRGLGHDVVRVRAPRGVEAEPTQTGFGAALAASPGFGPPPALGSVPALGSTPTPAQGAPPSLGLASTWASSFGPSFAPPAAIGAGPAWPAERDRPEIPWHDVPGQDPRRGEVARHGARREDTGPGDDEAGPDPNPFGGGPFGTGPFTTGSFDGWETR